VRSRCLFVVGWLLVPASADVMSHEPLRPLAVLGRPVPLPPSGELKPTARTSIHFSGPTGLKVTWQLPDGSFNDEKGLTAPKEYNFLQGQVYRLRTRVASPNAAGRAFYPTLEVAPATAKTRTFLAHASVPVAFSADDFAQAADGVLVVKVVYLPDPVHQDFNIVVGAEELASTRLEPGTDPIAEAQRRGTILAVVRLGNVDLTNPNPPPKTSPGAR